MKCPKCGHQNPPSKIVCSQCGTRLRAAAASSGPTAVSPEVFMARIRADLLRLVLVTVAVTAVAAALGLRLR